MSIEKANGLVTCFLAELPSECLGAYVISMAHYASDVLAVRLLQKVCGVVTPMRVSPLFETRDDLQAAPAVMRRDGGGGGGSAAQTSEFA